jgi:error-prone DNA polymerase
LGWLLAMRRAVPLPLDVWDGLARAGALDAVVSRREALWRLGLWRKEERTSVQPSLFEVQANDLPLDLEPAELVPRLDTLTEQELVAWDYATQSFSPLNHPVGLHREVLRQRGVRTIAEVLSCRDGEIVSLAGVVVVLQRPPTAKGMVFLVLEDETGRLPVAVTPQLYEPLRATLRAPALWVRGKVQVAGLRYRSVLTQAAGPLMQLIGRAEVLA